MRVRQGNAATGARRFPQARKEPEMKSLVGFAIAAVVVGIVGCNTGSTTIGPLPHVVYYTVYFGGSPSPPALEAITAPVTGANVPFAILSNSSGTGLFEAYNVATDSSGRLFAVNFNNAALPTTVSVFNPPITSSSSAAFILTLTGISGGFGIAIDASGNLWICGNSGNKMQEYVGPFTGNANITPAITLTNNLNFPEGAAFDAAGNLYVANEGIIAGAAAITIFLKGSAFTNGQLSRVTLNGAISPEGIAVDAAGNLYAGSNGVGIVRWNAATVAAAIAGPTSGATPDVTDGTGMSTNSFSSQLVFDAAGNLYDADCGSISSFGVYEWPTSTQAFTSTLAPVKFTDANITASQCVGGIAVH
jgi:hypothetical protein